MEVSLFFPWGFRLETGLLENTGPVAAGGDYGTSGGLDSIKGEEILGELLSCNQSPNDPAFDLRREAYLLQIAYDQNKLLSLSNSRTQILAHQVESTHRIINSLNRRFLIADEVGLGKTIEAGLVIKELIFKYDYSRILVVAPASLLMQWQSELSSKFNEHFFIMDRSSFMKSSREGGKGGRAPGWPREKSSAPLTSSRAAFTWSS